MKAYIHSITSQNQMAKGSLQPQQHPSAMSTFLRGNYCPTYHWLSGEFPAGVDPRQSYICDVGCKEILTLGQLRHTSYVIIREKHNRKPLRKLNLFFLGLTDSSSNRQYNKPMSNAHQTMSGLQGRG